MKDVKDFINKLVEEKGFETKDQEVLEQIKNDLLKRFEDRINAMIATNLPESKYEEFDSLLDEGDELKINEFILNNIENIEQKIAQEMFVFKSVYLA